MLFNSKKNQQEINSLKQQLKRNLEDEILILQKISEFNNQQSKGSKGSFLKNYTQRTKGINDMVDLTIEQLQEKIMDIDAKA